MSARPRKPPTQEPPNRPSEDVPTKIYDDSLPPTNPPQPRRSAPQAAQPPQPMQAISMKNASGPMQAISMKDASGPMQAISMKTPSDARPSEPTKTPALARPKLRAMSDVQPQQAPQNLGNLAPPYNPAEARARSVQDYVIWGCVAVIIGSAILLAVWFIAR